ncbi:MAG: RNA methyltransferase [Sphingobacteriaceae bacterium]|nr:RNA methyltransferase [Sphingobacteriaceae bacterium]
MPSFPQDFINSLKHIPGFNEEEFVKAHQTQAPTSIRINPFKRTDLNFEVGKNVPWAKEAFYLKERPIFTSDPLFHAGCYYVQEASSMFIDYVLKQVVNFDEELFALDLCAAPGGKSTILSSCLNKKSVLVSNEVVKNRADVLAYNLAKWGNCNHIVTNSETSSFSKLKGIFDLVLVDAPCSGSGLFRKQENAMEEWSMDAVTHCSSRQRTILSDVLPSLNTNGYLVYSTCSYSSSENEEIVKWLISEHGLEVIKLDVDPNWGIEDTSFGFRFYPHKLEGEGFFCCVLKVIDQFGSANFSKKNTFKEASKAEMAVLEDFIDLDGNHNIINHNGEFKLLNNSILSFINSFKNELYFKSVGTPLGEIKHDELIPHHFLALSNYIKTSVDSIELTDNESLKYLKKEAFQLQNESKGLKRFTNKGFGLGWGKNLGTRINNYLPSNFQIFNKDLGTLK